MSGRTTAAESHTATIARYFTLLEERDIDGWLHLWADDCVQVIPYAAGNLPSEVHGKEALGKIYREIHHSYVRLRFTDLEIYAVEGADQVFARWHPVGELVAGGQYENDTIGLFDFDGDGRITRFTEWFSPLGFDDSFAVS